MQAHSFVPAIDITPFLDGRGTPKGACVTQEVARACETSGFLVVAGHRVPEDLIAAMYDVTFRFFELPLEEKLRCRPPREGVNRGFTPVGSSVLAASIGEETPTDLRERFVVSRFDDPADAARAGCRAGLEDLFAPNIWPERPSELRQVWTAYYTAMEQLARTLMRILAVALGLDETWFDNKIGNHISKLLANYYPPQPEPPLPGQLRSGPHTDFGSLTILYQDEAAGGLQVRDHDGGWRNVPAMPGTFVVNLGDLMAQWTNDRWVSTMHRVVNPPRDRWSAARISIPFFHQPDCDAVIQAIPTCVSDERPPRYPPTTSGEWLLTKMGKIAPTDSRSVR